MVDQSGNSTAAGRKPPIAYARRPLAETRPSGRIEHGVRYNLGFTAASLRPELARIVAQTYISEGDWELAKKRVLSTNELQCRSASSLIRIERELRQRVAKLTHAQIELLAEATSDDRAAMAWLAAQKQSEILFDFAAEVLKEKLAAHDPVLRPSDYEAFFASKSAGHPELAELSGASKNKIRQVLLRMLLEAGLLCSGAGMGVVQRPVLSEFALGVIVADDRKWLAGFLFPDDEIRTL